MVTLTVDQQVSEATKIVTPTVDQQVSEATVAFWLTRDMLTIVPPVLSLKRDVFTEMLTFVSEQTIDPPEFELLAVIEWWVVRFAELVANI